MSDVLRMLDANANRAREGIRVMEDVARFVLDDAAISGRCKAVRHRVTEGLCVLGLQGLQLIAWRDASADVGTTLSTPGEEARSTLASVVGSNAGRAAEALRVLSETAKLLATTIGAKQAAQASEEFEAARYALYDIERSLVLALGACKAQPLVCVLVTQQLCTHHSWQRVIEQALESGADMIQLREKALPERELLSRAGWVVEACRTAGARSVINDRADIALLARAWGVHVGQDDLSVSAVRRLAGASLAVGVSTNNMAQALHAVSEGADLCGVGPMFATTTKHKESLAGPAYLREFVAHERMRAMPHLAIGGITLDNLQDVINAGARGIAVSSVVCGSRTPGEVVASLRAALALSAAPIAPADSKTRLHV